MFANRLRKNLKHLGHWLSHNDIRCYRLYDADLPEYAFAVDVYAGNAEIDQRWVHVQEYAAPGSVDPAKVATRRGEALSVIPEVLGITGAQLFFKLRRRQKGSDQYEKLAARGHFQEVIEAGNRFLVNFEDYLDTGLFLDHRKTRRLIRQEASGKRFLNLFAYTGAFSVHAAAGDAIATTTVDLSNTYLQWAKDNMSINGFTGVHHTYLRADVLGALEQKKIHGEFDLIVVDPPTVSKSKAMARSFDVQRDHPFILNGLRHHLAPEGAIYFSTNYRKFKLDADALAFGGITDITAKIASPDFRSPHALRCWRITRN